VTERESADELAALLHGALSLSRSGNRVAAIAALTSATGLAPDDLTAHRRLAAAYAVAGDRDGARAEYDRFVARLEAKGSFDAASVERAYAAVVLPPAIALVAPQRFTADQIVALRRVAVAFVAIVATLAAMFAAGAQIFASAGAL
jgi:DNA-binding SARP family transcriptional activator